MGWVFSRKLLWAWFFLSAFLISFQNCSNVQFSDAPLDQASVIPLCRPIDDADLQPELLWDWYANLDKKDPSNLPDFSQVMSTPMVADLDGDGFPEVVFSTFTTNSSLWAPDRLPNSGSYTANGVLRIIDGRTGITKKSISDFSLAPFATTSPLLVDLDGDGKIEIVYGHYAGKYLIALNSDGSFRWKYEMRVTSASYSSFSAADFNNDGLADIVTSTDVISEDKDRAPHSLWTFDGNIYQFGYEQRILGAAGVFAYGSSKLFSVPGARFVATADLDNSVTGNEIVSTGNGTLNILSGEDGRVLYSSNLVSISELKCPSGAVGGGVATIGDFDGHPENLEIAVATGKYLSIFDNRANLISKYETQDCSSLSTGISSFDFNGDGQPEILYADEEYFRVFQLINGELKVIQKLVNPSGTLLEYPVVADVDGNGSANIILASNNYAASSFYKSPSEQIDQAEALKTTGVRAFRSRLESTWMPTRKIWNQADYNPGLITERGQPIAKMPTTIDNYLNRMFRRNAILGSAEQRCIPKQ